MPKCGTIVSHACKKLKLFEPKHGKNYQKYPMVIAIDQHWWQISKSKTEKQGKKYQKSKPIWYSMKYEPTQNKEKIFFFKMI